jgi:folate-binding Fe-S cluster repair protein YgfZ
MSGRRERRAQAALDRQGRVAPDFSVYADAEKGGYFLQVTDESAEPTLYAVQKFALKPSDVAAQAAAVALGEQLRRRRQGIPALGDMLSDGRRIVGLDRNTRIASLSDGTIAPFGGLEYA